MRKLLLAVELMAVMMTVAYATDAWSKGKEKGDPDAPPAGVKWAVEPAELDFGEVAGGETKALGLKVLNQGGKEGTTRCAASGLGSRYVVVDKTGSLIIPAVGAIEVIVKLDATSALLKKGAKNKEKGLKDIPVKAAVTCGGKRAEVRAVIKPRIEEEVKKDEPPPPPKADEIPPI